MIRRLLNAASILACNAIEAHYRKSLRAIGAQQADQCPDDGDGFALPFNCTDLAAQHTARRIREAIFRELEAGADTRGDWGRWAAEFAHPSNGERP